MLTWGRGSGISLGSDCIGITSDDFAVGSGENCCSGSSTLTDSYSTTFDERVLSGRLLNIFLGEVFS